jgi:hypothetical protein
VNEPVSPFGQVVDFWSNKTGIGKSGLPAFSPKFKVVFPKLKFWECFCNIEAFLKLQF